MSRRLKQVLMVTGTVLVGNLAYAVFTPVMAEQEQGCGRSCHENGACHPQSGCYYCAPNPLMIGTCFKP